MANLIKTSTPSKYHTATLNKLITWFGALFIALIVLSTPALAEEPAQETGLIFTIDDDNFQQVVDGVQGDLEEDLSFNTIKLNKNSTTAEIGKSLKQYKPKVVVLVENNAVRLYQKYQKENPKMEFPPSVSVAAIFVDRMIAQMKNATAIRYEIPAVTSAVNMRSVLNSPVKKIGVVHRKWMNSLIERDAMYCKAEGVELVSIAIDNKGKNLDKQLKKSLTSLVKQGVDAILVLNDNALLNRNMISNAWLPVIGKAKLPVIVGIEPMLSTRLNIGSFAVVPDHYALGVQAASVIGEIMEEDWELGDREIEQPLSVIKMVNTAVLDKKRVKYNMEKLSSIVDKVIK